MPTIQNFVNKLSEYLRKNNKLEKIIKTLQNDYDLIPCIGVEIEFYLSKNINHLELETLIGIKIKKEKGTNQFEIDLPPSTSIINYIEQINIAQSTIDIATKKLKGFVDFSAKPFLHDYGNSMHFHMNFMTNNVPLDTLCQSICHYMLDSFLVLAPKENDYLRFDKNFMAPTNVSFGANNRTVAIRIPDLSPRRFEHRIANPLTDVYLTIFVILNSILLGLKYPSRINNINKI